MLIYARSRAQAAEVVRRALEFVLHVQVTNVSGSEECFAVQFDRGVMNADEIAEVAGDAEVYSEPCGSGVGPL